MSANLSTFTSTPVDAEFRRKCASFTEELESRHAVLIQALGVMKSATEADLPDREAYANARWRLSNASMARRTLCGRIYAHLQSNVTERDAATITRLQGADRQLLARSVQHVSEWSSHAIEAKWAEYCAASLSLRAAMRRCLSDEKLALYPLLHRLARPEPPSR